MQELSTFTFILSGAACLYRSSTRYTLILGLILFLISSYLGIITAKIKYMFLLKSKILKKEKGASAVEFALILTPLIILIFAIFEFGILFNNWIALTHAAREGVRLAAVDEDEAFIKQEIVNRAPSVKIDPDNIEIDPVHEEREIGSLVTVTVTGWPVDLNIPFLDPTSIPLASSATLRIENRQQF